jgi:hypothetical protein
VRRLQFSASLAQTQIIPLFVLITSTSTHRLTIRARTVNTRERHSSVCVTTWHSVVKPSSSVLTPLTKERDFIVLGSKLLNALTLTYNFELKEDSSTVKVRAPA